MATIKGIYFLLAFGFCSSYHEHDFEDIKVVGHPEFIETPSNTSVSLGSTALLRCTVLNLTGGANYVYWSRLKPEKKFLFIMASPANDDVSDRYKINGSAQTGDFHMQITSTQRSDAGVYECSVSQSNLKANATLTVLAPPLQPVLQLNQTANLREGDVIEAVCVTSGAYPKPTIQWTRRGNIIPASQHTDSSSLYGEVRSIVRFTLSSDDDRSALRCRVWNSQNLQNPLHDSHVFAVQYAPSVSILSPDPLKVITGSTARLHCEAKANPPTTSIRWYRSGTLLPDATSGVLELRVVSRQSAATYRCEATNQLGTRSADVSLHILYAPELTTPAAVTVVERTSRVITCSVDSNPAPELLEWRRDGQPLSANKPDSYTVELELSSVSRTDAGRYECVARTILQPSEGASKVVEQRRATQLVVQYKPGDAKLDIAPSVLVGQNVSLECVVLDLGLPRGQVVWTRVSDGALVGRGERLTLTSVTPADRGQYSCRAENHVGSGSSAAADLEVYEPPVWLPPQLEQTITQSQSRDSPLELSCTARARPAPQLNWLFGGRVLGEQDLGLYGVSWDRRSSSELNGPVTVTARLRFEGAARDSQYHLRAEDMGVYSCEASSPANAYPSVRQTTRLYIHHPPKIEVAHPRVAGRVGARVTLRCVVSGHPLPVVTWYDSSSRSLANDSDYSLIETESSEVMGVVDSKLVIHSLAAHMIGDFRCKAQSSQGDDAISSIKLQLASVPDAPTTHAPAEITWESVLLSWDAGFDGGDVQSFFIQIKEERSRLRRSERVIPVTPAGATSYNLTGLFPAVNYSFVIFSRNSLGSSPSSAPLHVKTPDLTLPIPRDVSLSDSDKLSWIGSEEMCARIDQQGGDGVWRVLQPCVLTQTVQVTKSSRLRVSLCLVSRTDVCGEQVYVPGTSESTDLPASTVIIISVVCALVIFVLLLILTVLCLRRQQRACFAPKQTNKQTLSKPTGEVTPITSTMALYTPPQPDPADKTYVNPAGPTIPVVGGDWPPYYSEYSANASNESKHSVLSQSVSDICHSDQNYSNEVRSRPITEEGSRQPAEPNCASLSSEESGYATEPKPKRVYYEVVV